MMEGREPGKKLERKVLTRLIRWGIGLVAWVVICGRLLSLGIGGAVIAGLLTAILIILLVIRQHKREGIWRDVRERLSWKAWVWAVVIVLIWAIATLMAMYSRLE